MSDKPTRPYNTSFAADWTEEQKAAFRRVASRLKDLGPSVELHAVWAPKQEGESDAGQS